MTIWKTKPTLVWKLSDWTFFEYWKERNEEKGRNQTKIYSSKFFVRNTWSASLDWWNFERWRSIYGAWKWKISSSGIIIQSKWCHDSSGKIFFIVHGRVHLRVAPLILIYFLGESTDRVIRESTGPNRSEICKILLILAWSEVLKIFFVLFGPDFWIFLLVRDRSVLGQIFCPRIPATGF